MQHLEYHTLENGIRLIHQPTNGMVAHCGLFINTGSRNEKEDEHGMVHFIEHMIFKGTSKRKAFHILSRLEDTGGELNAYTTKEETVIHASFLNHDYERAMELIGDIVFHSVFPPKEIKREKEVVIEEINSYKDSPGELIFDDFEEIVFRNHPVGRNILGTIDSVKAFSRDKILSFLRNNYFTDQMVFCSVGNIDIKRLTRLFNKYFSVVPSKPFIPQAKPQFMYSPVNVTRKLDTYQNHCIIGNIAYDIGDERRVGMSLLNNLLGGQGLNSRLNLSLRERRGFAYNVESSYNPYYDTGIFCVYFGTDSQNLEKSISIAIKEMDQLRWKPLGSIQLSKAKSQVKGYLARGYENHESLMLSMGKSMLAFNKIDSIEYICRKIDEVDSSKLLEIANEVLDSTRFSYLVYK
ncbi:MAG: pitrilysin family protein [Bacteroidales bacterium]